MKVLIVGLGVIGGSYAMGLKEKHEVYGIDKNIDTINKAKDQGYIIDGGDDPAKFLPFIDLVILACLGLKMACFIAFLMLMAIGLGKTIIGMINFFHK